MTVLQLMAILSKLPKDKKVIIHAYDAFDGIVAHVEDVSTERADENMAVDVVNHPKHYEVWDGLEAKEIVRMLLTEEEYNGWCKGNLIKYRMRAGLKNPQKIVEDIEKAEWFKRELMRIR